MKINGRHPPLTSQQSLRPPNQKSTVPVPQTRSFPTTPRAPARSRRNCDGIISELPMVFAAASFRQEAGRSQSCGALHW